MNVAKDWKQSALALDKVGVMSRRSIAKVLGVSKSTCSDYLRANGSSGSCNHEEATSNIEAARVGDEKHDNSRILVISDLHAPWNHPKAIDFLAGLKEKYNPTRIISVGDEVDKAGLSYHESDPDMPSAGDELKEAKKVIAKLFKLFPKMDILESNHGSLHLRKAMTAGIPRAYIKDYGEILGVDSGWKWYDDLIVRLPNGEDCYFTHGKSSNGVKLSQSYAMHAVQGHHHSEFNISYWSNPKNLFWSMQVGCLIDGKALAMVYNKLQLKRPIIGCGLIIEGKPILEALEM